MTEETKELLRAAYDALYQAEQAVRREEGASANRPLFRMRLVLGEFRRRHEAGEKLCDAVLTQERITAGMLGS